MYLDIFKFVRLLTSAMLDMMLDATDGLQKLVVAD